jgi:hypothetical protein
MKSELSLLRLKFLLLVGTFAILQYSIHTVWGFADWKPVVCTVVALFAHNFISGKAFVLAQKKKWSFKWYVSGFMRLSIGFFYGIILTLIASNNATDVLQLCLLTLSINIGFHYCSMLYRDSKKRTPSGYYSMRT